ncbi:MAG: hypothetical protein GY841_11240, partial [FCB group bacterium]|nr:hypothetical protein [FCB group bacterium]
LEDLGFGERHKKSMAFPEPGSANGWLPRRELRHHFDVLDRLLVTKTDVKNENNITAETNVNAYEYIGRSYRYLSKQRNNGDVINYLYDQGRRLTGIETKNKNENLINKYVYGYNKNHMKTFEQRVHEENKGDRFAYDAVQRLTGVKMNVPEAELPNADTVEFEKSWNAQYDKVDNILNL